MSESARQTSATFRCPFCGGAFGAIEKETDQLPGLTHSLPPCRKFLELDVVEFLAAARYTGRVHPID